MKAETYLVIGFSLQPLLVALLAVGKTIPADIIQGVPIRQLCPSQWRELLRGRMQFQFGSQHLFHRTFVLYFTENVKWIFPVSGREPQCPCPKRRNAHSSPSLEGQGTLGRTVEENGLLTVDFL